MKTFIFVIWMSLSSVATFATPAEPAESQAQVEEDLWSLTDARYAKNSLCDSYIDGRTYVIERESCTVMGCSAKWQYTQKTFCDGNKARIESWKQGSIYDRQEILLKDWQQTRGNLLRSKAAYSESFGNQFELVSAEELGDGTLRASYRLTFNEKVIETGVWILDKGAAIPTTKQQKMTQLGFLNEVTTDTFLREVR